MGPEYLVGFAIVLVTLGIVVSIGAVILGNIGQNNVIANDTDAQSIITNSKGGLTNMSSLFGVLGIVFASAVVIGTVYLIWRQ